MLIFGLSMVELYTVSATYHIGTGHWSSNAARRLRALVSVFGSVVAAVLLKQTDASETDGYQIYAIIKGTAINNDGAEKISYTASSVPAQSRAMVEALALTGVGVASLTLRAPRWVTAGLYVGMGWVALLALPAFLERLPWPAVGLLLLGGVLYSVGALIYTLKWPNPFPRVLGFHEVFHLFVIAGSVSFATVIAVWATVLPLA
jgi:hemolysin III